MAYLSSKGIPDKLKTKIAIKGIGYDMDCAAITLIRVALAKDSATQKKFFEKWHESGSGKKKKIFILCVSQTNKNIPQVIIKLYYSAMAFDVDVLKEYQTQLQLIAEALLKKGTLTGNEVRKIIENNPIN